MPACSIVCVGRSRARSMTSSRIPARRRWPSPEMRARERAEASACTAPAATIIPAMVQSAWVVPPAVTTSTARPMKYGPSAPASAAMMVAASIPRARGVKSRSRPSTNRPVSPKDAIGSSSACRESWRATSPSASIDAIRSRSASLALFAVRVAFSLIVAPPSGMPRRA